MALTLDATVGGAASNAYATLAEANAYHDGHYWAAVWDALIPSQRDIVLVMATRILDEQVEWYGTPTTRTQALRWPRYGVRERDSTNSYSDPYYGYTIDSTVIPLWLKNATAELARNLAAEDRTADAELLEFTQISVGTLSLTKDQAKQKDVIPDSVRAMVRPYGRVSGHSMIREIRLIPA